MYIFQLFFLLTLALLCQGDTTPFINGSNFGFANVGPQLTSQHISIDPVMGSQVVNGYIDFPIVQGSSLYYENGLISGGQVSFDGGARFSEQGVPDASFTFTNFMLSFDTGKVTATMDSKPNFPFGNINLKSMSIHKVAGKSTVSFSPTDQKILLDSTMLTTINAKFTSKLQVENHQVPITLTLVLDLLSGGNVDTALIKALHFEQKVDTKKGVEGVRSSSFDISY